MAWYEFWKRDTDDPLMKLFLEKYKLHLLPVPLEDQFIGDVCIYDGKEIIARSSITDFLEKPIQKPPITTGKMPDISGKISKAISLDIGIDLLGGFLNAFGIETIIQKIHQNFKDNGVKSLKFSFNDVIKNSINVVKIATDLMKNTFAISENNPLYSKTNRYYLVSAVARTDSINIITEDNENKDMNFDAKAMYIANISTNVSIENSTESQRNFLRDQIILHLV